MNNALIKPALLTPSSIATFFLPYLLYVFISLTFICIIYTTYYMYSFPTYFGYSLPYLLYVFNSLPMVFIPFTTYYLYVFLSLLTTYMNSLTHNLKLQPSWTTTLKWLLNDCIKLSSPINLTTFTAWAPISVTTYIWQKLKSLWQNFWGCI